MIPAISTYTRFVKHQEKQFVFKFSFLPDNIIEILAENSTSGEMFIFHNKIENLVNSSNPERNVKRLRNKVYENEMDYSFGEKEIVVSFLFGKKHQTKTVEIELELADFCEDEMFEKNKSDMYGTYMMAEVIYYHKYKKMLKQTSELKDLNYAINELK